MLCFTNINVITEEYNDVIVL